MAEAGGGQEVETAPDDGLPYLRGKAAVAGGIFFVLLCVLVWRLWSLQVRQGQEYYQQAQAEALRPIPLIAKRGEIIDRNGTVLARDVPSFAATLGFTAKPPSTAEIALLALILGIPNQAIAGAAAGLRSPQGTPFSPVVLKSGLTAQQHTLLAENAWRLPGVQVVAQPVRTYPGIPNDLASGGALAANIVGYVRAGDQPADVQGATGVEKSFNRFQTATGQSLGLAGVDGREQLEVNPDLRPLRSFGTVAPVPGDTVVLTIDAGLQAVAEEALAAQLVALRTRTFGSDGGPFPDAYSGAAAVVDVRTGEILALASEPTVDPGAFARNVAALQGSSAAAAFGKTYQGWLAQRGAPFVDHAISDAQPPGSTFKPITAIAALEAGVITPAEHLNCPASIPLGNGYTLNNWLHAWGGSLNLTEAIARSCDTYFYVVGRNTGITAIDRVATEFGLGQLTGQKALQGENPGVVSSPAVAMQRYQQRWTEALTMQTAIGQGLTLVNPLQMADYVAALANGGTLWRPYLVSEVRAPDGHVLWRQGPQVHTQIPLSPAIVQALRQAMSAVTEIHPAWFADGADSDFGTGYWPFYKFSQEAAQYLGRSITVAGKTGTAETGTGTPDGWFVSWAPADHPEIAVVVYSQHSGEGFVGGAPVAREIYDYYFKLDQAMWQAGQADQIVPPEVQLYYGLQQHYPSWWGPPPSPPASATAASGTAPAAAASAGSGGAAGTTPGAGAPAGAGGAAGAAPGGAGAPANAPSQGARSTASAATAAPA